MRKIECAGVAFNIVNELPKKTQEKLVRTIIEIEEAGNVFALENVLDFLGGGACGGVFDLGGGCVLKVNTDHRDITRDGIVLDDLQGLPFVPTLYWYSADNKYIVVQKIEGVNVGHYSGEFSFSFCLDQFERNLKKFLEGCKKAGWRPNDLHGENCMIDREGNFWVVDFGLFKNDSRPLDISKFELQSHADEVVQTQMYRYRARERELNNLFLAG